MLIQAVLITGQQELDSRKASEDLEMYDDLIDDHDIEVHDVALTSSLSSSSSDSESSSSSSSDSSSESSESSSSMDSILADIPTDDESNLDPGPLAATTDLLNIIAATRVVNPHQVSKYSQLQLVLEDFKQGDPKRFRRNLRVSPDTFDSLLEMIHGHSVFINNSHYSQTPVSSQLAITLFRLGHDGNAASVESVAQWAGVSAGTVVNCTRRTMIAVLTLHDSAIHWPSAEEKEEAKQWVEDASCPMWRDGYCMVDGTQVVLFQKPGHHGEAYFDRKSNYSLNIQVCGLV
jgi:hypothetical protein